MYIIKSAPLIYHRYMPRYVVSVGHNNDLQICNNNLSEHLGNFPGCLFGCRAPLARSARLSSKCPNPEAITTEARVS